MTDHWALAYQALASEVARRGLTMSGFAESAGVHRSTLDRMRKGEKLADETLWKIEGWLGLPRDLLTYVAGHDLAAIRETTAEADLLRWLTLRLEP